MKNYLISIITVCIGIGVFDTLSPRFKGIEKYIKIIGGLIILCIVISPLAEFVHSIDLNVIDEIKNGMTASDSELRSDYGEILNEYLNTFSIEEMKGKIKEILYGEFQIPDNECEVEIFTEVVEGSLSVVNVKIALLGKSIFKNPYTIEDRFKELLGCDCQVFIK